MSKIDQIPTLTITTVRVIEKVQIGFDEKKPKYAAGKILHEIKCNKTITKKEMNERRRKIESLYNCYIQFLYIEK